MLFFPLQMMDSLKNKFFLLGLFLLPYDALPVMPSVYRPVSCYFFVMYLFLYLIEHKGLFFVNKPIKLLSFFLVYAVTIGLVTSFLYVGHFLLYLDFFGAFIMGFIAFFSCSTFFSEMRKFLSQDSFIWSVFYILGAAYAIPVCVGVVETFCLYSPFQLISVKYFLNSIFGGWQLGRPCITTFEASWAATHMLFVLPVYWFLFQKRKTRWNAFLFIGGCVSFFACFSMQGFLLLIIAYFVYSLMFGIVYHQFFKSFFRLLQMLLFCSILIYAILLVAEDLPSSYITNRILNFDLQNILYLDGSVFVRIGFPLIAFRIFMDHIVFGTGPGSFAFVFRDYVFQYYPTALVFDEVIRYCISGMQATATIGIRCFAELGIIGGTIFWYFYYTCLYGISNLSPIKKNLPVIFWGAILCAFLAQQGSYAYVPMWVGLAFFVNVSPKT